MVFGLYQNEKDQTMGTEIIQNLSGAVELHFLVRSVFFPLTCFDCGLREDLLVVFSPLNPKAGILDVRASFWTVLVFTAGYWRTIKLDSCQEVSYSNMSGADTHSRNLLPFRSSK